MKKKIILSAGMVLIAIIFLTSTKIKVEREEIPLYEKFENKTGIITKISEFNLDMSIDNGVLHLNSSKEKYGGGIWKRNLSVKLSQDSKISWQLYGNDLGRFQFWIKVKFNNNRAIYYVADNSITPEYPGERYRDLQGRIRLMPSIIILGNPLQEKKWTRVERNIGRDYERYCGRSGDLRIVEISVGMLDHDIEHRNELMIDNITINNF